MVRRDYDRFERHGFPAPPVGLPSFINAVTVTLSSTPSYRPMGVVEYTGLQQTPAAVDVTNSATGSGTTASCAVTTLNATDLVVAFATGNTGALGAAGQTHRTSTSPDGSGIEDITLTSAGLQTMTGALGSGKWLMAAVAFKAGRFSAQYPGAILHS